MRATVYPGERVEHENGFIGIISFEYLNQSVSGADEAVPAWQTRQAFCDYGAHLFESKKEIVGRRMAALANKVVQ